MWAASEHLIRNVLTEVPQPYYVGDSRASQHLNKDKSHWPHVRQGAAAQTHSALCYAPFRVWDLICLILLLGLVVIFCFSLGSLRHIPQSHCICRGILFFLLRSDSIRQTRITLLEPLVVNTNPFSQSRFLYPATCHLTYCLSWTVLSAYTTILLLPEVV